MPHVGIKRIFRCYEAKIEESEKAGSRRESNPGHLACAASALPLSYNKRTNHQPPQSSICTAQGRLKCLSRTLGSHSVCAVIGKTILGGIYIMIFTCHHRNKGKVDNNAHHNMVFLMSFDWFRCYFLDRSKRDLICSLWRRKSGLLPSLLSQPLTHK